MLTPDQTNRLAAARDAGYLEVHKGDGAELFNTWWDDRKRVDLPYAYIEPDFMSPRKMHLIIDLWNTTHNLTPDGVGAVTRFINSLNGRFSDASYGDSAVSIFGVSRQDAAPVLLSVLSIAQTQIIPFVGSPYSPEHYQKVAHENRRR